MSENALPRWLQVLEVWAKIVAGVALPVLLFAFGLILSQHQQEADRKERERKQLMDIGTFLTTDDPRKVEFAAVILQRMKDDGVDVPRVLVDAFTKVANKGPESGPKAPKGAAATSDDAATAAQQAAAAVLSGLTPRVFLHIAEDGDRAAAERLRQSLQKFSVSGQPVAVPGVERKPDVMPDSIELRYFKKDDANEAAAIGAEIARLALAGKAPLSPKYVAGFETAKNVKARTYELWLPAGSLGGRSQ